MKNWRSSDQAAHLGAAGGAEFEALLPFGGVAFGGVAFEVSRLEASNPGPKRGRRQQWRRGDRRRLRRDFAARDRALDAGDDDAVVGLDAGLNQGARSPNCWPV